MSALATVLVTIRRNLAAVLLLMLSFDIHGRTDEEMARLAELDRQCLQARAALLQSIQKPRIEECVREGNKSRAECEVYWRDYGWGAASGQGTRAERFFDQIPECVASFNAWKSSGE